MGLSAALYNAISGMSTNQTSINLVSENVANAQTQGYTKKTARLENAVNGTSSAGVRIADITRDIDLLLQSQLRSEISNEGESAVKADLLGRLDQLLGVPGDTGSLDVTYDEFVDSLRGLSDSPNSVEARTSVINQATALAGQLVSLSTKIQELRSEGEAGIERSALEVNRLITELAAVNEKIGVGGATTSGEQGLLDQRDMIVTEMSQYLEIKVQATESGQARVYTSTGHLLIDGSYTQKLSFDGRPAITPQAVYSSDASERTVGTVYLTNGANSIDLFSGNGIQGGQIGAYRELRDDILVKAQSQLDEIAAGLAEALSSVEVEGTATSVGAQDGFDIDVGSLQAGNPISVTYTQTPPGTETTVTLIRVDDATSLPLSNSDTANPDDVVFGIDFSSGLASAATDIGTALGGSFTVSSPAVDTIRILDDGAVGTIDISAVDSVNTASATVDEGLALALFADGAGGAAYTGSPDSNQKLGYAARITVNPTVSGDQSTLVIYSTSPATSDGDATRPTELLSRLVDAERTFSATTTGLGSEGSPVIESIGDFTRRFISNQAAQAETAQQVNSTQATITRSMEDRMQETSGVNVDEEIADLIVLQNSFAASARVISVVQELMQTLLRI